MWNNPRKKIRCKTALQCSPLFTQHVKSKALLTCSNKKTVTSIIYTLEQDVSPP